MLPVGINYTALHVSNSMHCHNRFSTESDSVSFGFYNIISEPDIGAVSIICLVKECALANCLSSSVTCLSASELIIFDWLYKKGQFGVKVQHPIIADERY